MKFRQRATSTILAFLFACLGSAATICAVAAAAEPARRYERMLVVAGGADAFLKEDAEEAIVAKLERYGIDATVGIRVIGPRTKFNRSVIEPYIASGKYDSVLFVRATLAEVGEVRPRDYGAYESTGNLDDYYDVAMLGYLAGPKVVGGDFNALATLFDVAERKAVWSENYSIANPGNPDRVIAKIAGKVERGLKKAGYLKKK